MKKIGKNHALVFLNGKQANTTSIGTHHSRRSKVFGDARF